MTVDLVAQFRVELRKFTADYWFDVCPELSCDMIIGSDFFLTHKCILDYERKSLRVRNHAVPFERKSSQTSTNFLNLGYLPVMHSVAPFAEIDTMLGTNSSLATSHVNKLRELVIAYHDVFSWEGQAIGRSNVTKHEIHTEGSRPVWIPPRRIPVHYEQELGELIADMLKKNIIKPSTSPWSSPLMLVHKKDGSLRVCVDYRKLNSITKRDSFPLPRIDTTLDALRGSPVFSTLDLAAGYWQVELKDSDKAKTAFAIPSGLYEFQTMPFGLSNAPATFQRMMPKVLAGLVPHQCLVYLDDIIIHGQDLDTHLSNLETVFQRVRDAGLTLNPSKCKLIQQSVEFLGYRISSQGITTQSDKVETITSWPTPVNATEVRSFLGLAGYYRRFIPSYATIAAPLRHLTHQGRKFEWTTEVKSAFEDLKSRLCSTPILAYPDVDKGAGPFILDTDASNEGIGGVLSQIQRDGSEKPLCYGSRSLSDAEKRYCVTRKELLAVVAFSRQFRVYLIGRQFILRTDHQSLRWLLNFKDPLNQLARWQEEIQNLDYKFVHRPGPKHGNADGLS